MLARLRKERFNLKHSKSVRESKKRKKYRSSTKWKNTLDAYEKSPQGKIRKLGNEKSKEGQCSRKVYAKLEKGNLRKIRHQQSNRGEYSRRAYGQSDEGNVRKI